MKKAFLTVLLVVGYLSAQQFKLEWVNPKPTGSNLMDIEIITPNNIQIFGVASTIIKSSDGLNNYTLSYIDDNRIDVWAVDFVTPDIGYLCGDNGMILKTTNGGLIWSAQNSWVTSRLYDIEFLNPDSGIVVGASGLVLITTNGGINWNTTYYQTSTNYTIEIVDRNLIFIGSAASTGRLAKSTDFGTTWTPITHTALTSSVYSIHFLNESFGWVGTGSSGILFTSDGGTSWTQQIASANIIYDVLFSNSQIGFAVDARGIIYSTINGGTNWTTYQTPERRALRSIAIDGNNVYTVGDAGSMYHSTNLGNSWERKFSYIGQALEFQRRVIFVNQNVGFICGGSTTAADSLGYLLKTTDGGETWTQLPYNFKTQLYAIAAPNENVIYTSAGSSLVFKSTDGGQNWTRTTIFGTATTLWDIQFYNENLGYACGSSGRVFKTTNGGASWSLLSGPFGTSTLYSIAILDSNSLIITGVSALAFKSTNGGSTWTQLSPGIPGSYFIVRFKENVGYIGSFVSPSGYVSKSTDWGSTWTPLISYPGIQSVWGIAVKSADTVFVTDLFGYVYYSTNGGNDWIPVPRIFGSNSFYCSFGGDNLFISGSNGAIIKGYFPPPPPPDTRSVTYDAGWNILSVPLKSTDMRKNSLFPDAVSSAFAYLDGYYTEDTLKLGKGYWLKFNDAGSVNIIGYKTNSYSIDLNSGWNLFGVFDLNVQTNDVTTNPPNIIVSNFFKFDKGYKVTDVLEVGKGYWIKLNQAGTLTFPSFMTKPGYYDTNASADEMKIIISDRVGNVSELYISQTPNTKFVELPPIPPKGIFDVRFENDRMVESFDNEFKTIQINSALYPLTIELKGFDADIQDCINGQLVNQKLYSGKKFVIDNKNISMIKIRPTNIVYDFAIYQNYPNPFNPATTIRFSIPEKMNVKITVYDVLGRIVTELLNETRDAGIHKIIFDGSRFTSGIYFYRIDAGKFSNVKKMILIK